VEEEDDSPPLTPEQLNDENFRTAAISLKENEPTWAMQLEMVLQRPVTLSLDFDSLNGSYALVQPFIHQALTATLEAITSIAFDPAFKTLTERIEHVTIAGTDTFPRPLADLTGATLAVTVPIKPGDARPPTPDVLKTLRALLQKLES
jgi:hypothetical protein